MAEFSPEALKALLEKTLGDRIRNPVRILKSIGVLVTSRTQARFRDEQDPDGTTWPERMFPNIPGILDDLQRGASVKDRRFQVRPVLSDTGRLRQSINYELVSLDTVKIGTNIEYAKYHQFGLERVIPITQVMRDGLKELIRKLRGQYFRATTTTTKYGRPRKKAPSGQMRGTMAFDPGNTLGRLFRMSKFKFTAMERPFVGLSDQDQRDINAIIAGDILKDLT